jgi:sugar phosphate isomerase/epimerase
MDRRNFIKNTSLAAASLGISDDFLDAAYRKKLKPNLQLYTLRDDLKNDLVGTIRKIVKMGYTTVEHAGYNDGKVYDLTAKEFRKICIDEGLSVVSGHILTGRENPTRRYTMLKDFERVVDDMKTLNQKYIVCAWLFPEERTCLDDYKKLTDLLNKCGETCKQYGIVFAYHNHDFEFQAINKVVPYDILLRETEADLVKFEMDMYWVEKSNQNPIKYFEQYPKRFPLWHIKDMDKEDASKFAPVGKGKINFAPIFANKEKAGLKHYFVEQDNCYDIPPIESVQMSLDFIKKQNWGK